MALLYAVWRVIRNAAYLPTIWERLGNVPKRIRHGGAGAIWIHAVSVGEVLSTVPLIRELKRRFGAPIFVSTSTLAGHQAGLKRLEGLASGVFYAPIDTIGPVRRVLRSLKPSVVVVLETEIWPNLFRETKRAGCGLILANARISDAALPKYQKYRWFFAHVLCWPDCIFAQSETMRRRFVQVGAPLDRVTVAGNLKFDTEAAVLPSDSTVKEWIEGGDGPLLIAASTTADEATDEDRAMLEAFRNLEGWRLILAPRKPERFAKVAEMMEREGIAFWRRTDGFSDRGGKVLLLDTVGELGALFGLADVVFMGGTLTATGGHNFLEPAIAGKPVIVGPRLENFQEIADDFRAHEALIEIRSPGELASAATRALGNHAVGMMARERAEAKRGAAKTIADAIEKSYEQSIFCVQHGWATAAFLTPLSWLWGWGAARRGRRELARKCELKTPVISIGNLTLGGTGKTPFVLHLAKRFRERGIEPFVLTRGHGRISPHSELIVSRGSSASVWHTGDEPQIFLRSGMTGLGIGRDRYRAGLKAEKTMHPDVFLLDDGFSHRRLKRDIDVVLVDALDPFGGCELVPLGRLREPLEALQRADVVVITRCEQGSNTKAIERRIRQYNTQAAIFRSSIIPRAWVSLRSGEEEKLPARVVAFCGLGNAGAFWRSLERMGVATLDEICYSDHHQYPPRELAALVRHARTLGAEALATTEKDVVNFGAGSEQVLEGMQVYWLRIDVEIENEAELLRIVNPADIRERGASDRQTVPVHP